MTKALRRDVLKASGALVLSSTFGNRHSAAFVADPYEDAILHDGEPAEIRKGSFTIAVLPDTQNYSENYPEIYQAQTKWIVDNRAARNIACVLHLGDITNHNTVSEWENAAQAMKLLDGHVPYFLVLGNHDYSERGGCRDRTTLANNYFPVGHFQKQATFGGTYDREPDRIENSFHLFEAEGRKFIVLALEFGPRRDVVRWANEVMGGHQDREAILITHAYMYFDDTRYDWAKFGGTQNWNPHSYPLTKQSDDVCDGEELWNKLVSRHKNFILTLNGHVLNDGLGRLTSATPDGRNIHQMLVNFQMRPKGGDGWLRLLEFQADIQTVQVVDYSPTRNQLNQSPQNQFELKLSAIG
ncbi:MAG: metallophosphoesterase [Pirellulaceae bacterium]|nr:metallophosphoesterase [Pirellulaceae bacterium]